MVTSCASSVKAVRLVATQVSLVKGRFSNLFVTDQALTSMAILSTTATGLNNQLAVLVDGFTPRNRSRPMSYRGKGPRHIRRSMECLDIFSVMGTTQGTLETKSVTTQPSYQMLMEKLKVTAQERNLKPRS